MLTLSTDTMLYVLPPSLFLSVNCCSIFAWNDSIGNVPMVAATVSSDPFLMLIVMLPVGKPYFLKLIRTDFTETPKPEAHALNCTPVLPIPPAWCIYD